MLQLIQNWGDRIINISRRLLRNHPFIKFIIRIIAICVIFAIMPILWLFIGLIIWILFISTICIVGFFIPIAIFCEFFNRLLIWVNQIKYL
ncbi:unnamed protein product [Rhizophagus irregularis]|uniref:Uncharacterized protein n=1 Tax=Rhizophagus irregularis TaxID=588596 RepID=A0A915YP96_9GLOM|nr:unnamed protein product [Rhizophagus irregularis]CAB4408910.1 unnamed protein product [Rhizophagus irregularis]CAB4409618.1 unnamed protein product [Rhizophagus irregularis]CAB4496116.1 unnamed protein product [Rhizophagus irregularis]CAB5216425.1 unnamed protein product [Rhizophagus irregularis]